MEINDRDLSPLKLTISGMVTYPDGTEAPMSSEGLWRGIFKYEDDAFARGYKAGIQRMMNELANEVTHV